MKMFPAANTSRKSDGEHEQAPVSPDQTYTKEQWAEVLARRMRMSIQIESFGQGRCKARTSAVSSVSVYGYGDSIHKAILDCAERAAAIEKALPK